MAHGLLLPLFLLYSTFGLSNVERTESIENIIAAG